MKKNGGGGRGSGRSIETSFHRATPYIAWENKSCGHSPGGRLDTGRCHRTRVAATATDRVREREDGYQWLHYTIPGGEGGGRGEGAGVCVSKCKRERRDANAKGPHHLERIEEPSNEALGIYIYMYIYKARYLLPRRKERGSGPRVEAYDVYARYEKRRNRARTARRGCCMPAVRAPPCFLHRFTFRQAFRRLDIDAFANTEPCTAMDTSIIPSSLPALSLSL